MKSFFLASMLLTFCFVSTAQDEPKVVVFNSPKSERKPSEIKNVLKFGMLEPFSGSFSLYYERVLNSKLSAEVGLGLTIDDYLSLAINNIDEVLGDETHESKLGQAFALGLRYYPGIVPEDFYFAPEFRFKRYVSGTTYVDSDGISQSLNESKVQSIGRITFGYHYLVSDNIFWDFYGGFGIGKDKVVRLDYNSVYDSETGTYEDVYTEYSGSSLKPKLHIGIKLGIGFK